LETHSAPGWEPRNFRLARTLQRTTLLLFTGLSVAIAFRAGLFNIGTQGQLVLGGLATAVVVSAASGPVPAGVVGTLVLIPVGVLVGAVVGGVWGAIPGALKAYAGANEVITTIMLNFVATGIAATLLSWRFQDPNSLNPQTSSLPDYATIPTIPSIGFDPQLGFSLLALMFALLLAVGIAWMLTQTAFGYSLRVSGVQPAAAAYGGVEGKQMIVASMTLSGAVGGVAGSFWVLMVHGRWLENVPALGFDGIAVSVLAGNSPLGIGAAAFLFGLLDSGTGAVQITTSVPPDLIGVISGLVVLFVAMPEFFRLLGRYTQLGTQTDEAVTTDGGTPVGPRSTRH
jgi:nucleoside ABC transporter membrane protein